MSERVEKSIARPLKVLIPLIKVELQAGEAAALEHYRVAGEMLLEAKDQVGHGAWGIWLKQHFHLTDRTARRYMEFAETDARVRFGSLREAVPQGSGRPARLAYGLNVEALRQERREQEEERRLISDLAVQIINVGYRILAPKFHPDKGGAEQAMLRLNEARKILKEAARGLR